jgi:hypothetical protein
VPCHRVIGADGSLTGYGGGLDRKQWLLAHEGLYWFEGRRPPPGVTATANPAAPSPSGVFPSHAADP